MVREIFRVTAEIVDANGTYNSLQGYPKIFDSKNYGNDVAKTHQRAVGDWHDVLGAMAKIDTRKLQIAQVIELSTGAVIQNEYMGKLNDEEPEAQEDE